MNVATQMDINDRRRVILMGLRQAEMHVRDAWYIIGAGLLIGGVSLIYFFAMVTHIPVLSLMFLALSIGMSYILVVGVKKRSDALQNVQSYKKQLEELDRPQSTIHENAMVCNNCGKPIVGAGLFCQSCGTKIN